MKKASKNILEDKQKSILLRSKFPCFRMYITDTRDIFFAMVGVTTVIYLFLISAVTEDVVYPSRGTGDLRLFSHFPPPIVPHQVLKVDTNKPIAIVGDIHG